MTDILPIGSTIGIIGGGQLGRMLAMAAARLGFRTHIFDPDSQAPALQVASEVTIAAYTDAVAVQEFANAVDIVTYEFENIPVQALDIIEELCAIAPNRDALATAQDRLFEKNFITRLGLKTALYTNVERFEQLVTGLGRLGMPSILKTRALGYDGKGQHRITDDKNLEDVFNQVKGTPSILEEFVSFEKEISVIVARNKNGQIVSYDPGENIHEHGVLKKSIIPASLSPDLLAEARNIGETIVQALDYIGVLGVELFVTKHGLVVNEIAPRVHNSGHWTQNGCAIDQFEQHIRAIANWPLGNGKRHSDIEMVNLLGHDIDMIDKLRADPSISLHIYGKTETRPGRKMGHYNRIRH